MVNRYLVPLKYLVNSNSHSNFEFKGKIKFITVTLAIPNGIFQIQASISIIRSTKKSKVISVSDLIKFLYPFLIGKRTSYVEHFSKKVGKLSNLYPRACVIKLCGWRYSCGLYYKHILTSISDDRK
jgi:hypothetical protein